jgi:hypothetical protein
MFRAKDKATTALPMIAPTLDVRAITSGPATTTIDPATVQLEFYDYSTGAGQLELISHPNDPRAEQGYEALVNNYIPGNDIFLFGFSRGAYTARSLSGFIEKAGMIKKTSMHLFPEAFRAYREQKWDAFKREHPNITHLPPGEVPIHFLGVWDTVGSLGAPTPLLRRITRRQVSFHSTKLAVNVTHAYQALALHEVRAHFKPALWTRKRTGQIVEQVWFPGAHSDVGGGLAHTGLSDAALDWMMTRATAAGLQFDAHYRAQFVQPNPTAPMAISLRGMFWPFPAYVRPIGKNHVDEEVKSESLDEYIHSSATARLAKQPDRQWHWLRDWRKRAYLRTIDERARKLPLLPEDRLLAEAKEHKEQEAARHEEQQEEARALSDALIQGARRKFELLKLKLKLGPKGDPGETP